MADWLELLKPIIEIQNYEILYLSNIMYNKYLNVSSIMKWIVRYFIFNENYECSYFFYADCSLEWYKANDREKNVNC